MHLAVHNSPKTSFWDYLVYNWSNDGLISVSLEYNHGLTNSYEQKLVNHKFLTETINIVDL